MAKSYSARTNDVRGFKSVTFEVLAGVAQLKIFVININ
jgi:hypothetical protein